MPMPLASVMTQRRALQLVLFSNDRADVRKLYAHAKDASEVEEIATLAIARQAELRAHGPVAASLRRGQIQEWMVNSKGGGFL
jgi:hypothetical protein